MKTPRPFRCWTEIDLVALGNNIQGIRQTLPPKVRYIAVVKADAYGHGLLPTVEGLINCGIDMLAVANTAEAIEIRNSGCQLPLLLLASVLEEEEPYLTQYALTPTLSTEAELERCEALVCKEGRPLSVHLKIDTGMGRLGVWHTEAAALYQRVQRSPYVRLEGIYTHFSSMAIDGTYTQIQLDRFHSALATLPGADASGLLIHTNSIDVETFDVTRGFNAVRVGLLQFGVPPYPGSLSGKKAEPVLSFHSRIGLVKTLPAKTSISYNHTHTLKRPSRIAVLTAGYSDGIPTHLSNKGYVLIQGHRCPIIGRVTMDQTLVDVTGLRNVKAGETATFIGTQGETKITAAEFSAWADEIPWEVLCVISRKVPRLYNKPLQEEKTFNDADPLLTPRTRIPREDVVDSPSAAV